jgi:Flp pilus assembly protein TadD
MIPSEGGKVYLLDSNQPAFEAVERLDLSAFGIERLDGLPLEQVRRNIHVVAGKKLMAKKNHLGAAKHFRAAMSLGDHSVLSDLGDCLANEGQLEEAALCYAEALEDSPPSARAMVGLGVLRLMGGDGDAASGFFERALALEPANAQALCGMGLAANIAGKGDAAFDWFLKALDAAPSNQAAIHELVKGAYEQGRFAEAEARIRRFLEFEPSNAHLLFSLAGICHRQGKRADALDALDRLDLFSPEYDGAADLRTHVAS